MPHTNLDIAVVFAVAAVGLLALPWSRAEIAATWGAWGQLGRLCLGYRRPAAAEPLVQAG